MKFFIKNINVQRLAAITLAGLLTCACLTAQAQNALLPQPTIDQSESLRFPHFGSDRTVALLGDILLKSTDVNERMQAAADLGQTNNLNAVKYLANGFADKTPDVRQAVVSAAASLAAQTPEYMHAGSAEYKQAVEIVKKAFSDPSQDVQLAAISADALIDPNNINLHNRFGADLLSGKKVFEPENLLVKIAESDNPILAVAAMNVLNRQRRPLKDEVIIKHLTSNNVSLQIAAAENITFRDVLLLPRIKNLNDKPTPLKTALEKLSSSSNEALAAVAIEGLAKYFATSAKTMLGKAAKSKSPLLRRAAVNGFASYYEWEKIESKPTTKPAEEPIVPTVTKINFYDKIPPFMEDQSPLVKLAAVQAVEKARKNGALVDQTQKLMDIAFEASDSQLHDAAISAALAADGENLIKIAAAAYKKMMPEYLAAKNPEGTLLERNLSSVCKILVAKKSQMVFSEMLGDMQKLGLNSVILGDVVDALGVSGNQAAVAPLEKLLRTCQATGAKYLIAMASMSTPPPFSEEVTVKVIDALVNLDAKSATKNIVNIGRLNVMGMRLATVSAAIPPALVKLRNGSNESDVDKLITEMIIDRSYGNTTIFNAIIAAGQLRLSDALENINAVLNEERPSKITIWAAAWAVGQITGKYPAQPQPVSNQGGWIIKSVE